MVIGLRMSRSNLDELYYTSRGSIRPFRHSCDYHLCLDDFGYDYYRKGLINYGIQTESLDYINRFGYYQDNLFRASIDILALDYGNNSKFLIRDYDDEIENEENKINMKQNNIYNKISKISNNPIVIGIETAALNYCVNKIKTTFGMKLQLEFDYTSFKKFLRWLKKYDKLFKRRICKIPYKPYVMLKDADFFIKLDDFTFARILTGNSIKNSLSILDRKERSVGPMSVDIYVFGKNVKKFAYELNELNKNNHLVYYTITSSKRGNSNHVEIYRDLSAGRYKESVFLNENIKESILNHVQKFFNNKEIYSKRNLAYKTGILLHGEPGTGKSTIANMIATEFNCSMVIIKMNEFSELDIDFITSTINADDETYVVLLEDIDCVIGDRESENEDLENKKNVNKLLQFLDSASSPSNVIFVATTNHIEKLDNAILRDGRFDLKVEITNINEPVADTMCRSFGIKDSNIIKRIFTDNNIDGRINPAKLQNLILKEIE